MIMNDFSIRSKPAEDFYESLPHVHHDMGILMAMSGLNLIDTDCFNFLDLPVLNLFCQISFSLPRKFESDSPVSFERSL
jgi:hypothetical protein